MHIRVPKILLQASGILRRLDRGHGMPPSMGTRDAPKGYVPVYVGGDEEKKDRFMVPIAYLKHPLFQELLRKAEEEFGFDPPMGGLTLPCTQDQFLHLTSHLNGS